MIPLMAPDAPTIGIVEAGFMAIWAPAAAIPVRR